MYQGRLHSRPDALTLSQEYKKALGDKFEIVLAFSRDGPKKVYVQHRLKEYEKEVNELLEKKAYFYVCGDAANMAREVNSVLAQIIAGQRNIPEAKAEEIVKSMRSSNQYQVRPAPPRHATVWPLSPSPQSLSSISHPHHQPEFLGSCWWGTRGWNWSKLLPPPLYKTNADFDLQEDVWS